jgi:hypothetical protein
MESNIGTNKNNNKTDVRYPVIATSQNFINLRITLSFILKVYFLFKIKLIIVPRKYPHAFAS